MVESFAELALERVRLARRDLETAAAEDDAYAIACAADELDDAIRIARSLGLQVTPGDGAAGPGRG
ncbi:hypothetical protein SRB5_68200 [Streptomyces sp. RB5]|uniref:Uncharacterized protein n=1 Tax=Streptomyces smaragdinus TaxID=2585196 RepID=A0A7K0CT57_9ACTN|nr:hypothetical protein [Streptomyces smaragdinus]MQY16618.1 hypothetical protein [Streptomyces smaragdinus]